MLLTTGQKPREFASGCVTGGLKRQKAALAGAIAFDPHEERLSNLVQDTWLANPVTEWLAASPDDTAAEGRLKAALESIALDTAIIFTFTSSTKVWKALRRGDAEEASRLVDQMQAEQRAQIEAAEAAELEEGLGVQPSTAIAEEQPSMPAREADPTEAAGSPQDGLEPPAGTVLPEEAPRPPTDSVESANGIPEAGLAASPEQPAIVASPTDAADAAGTTLNSPQPRIRLSDEDTQALLTGMEADAEAIAKAGGWYQAIQGGHTFGKGEGVPWVKLNADADVDDFMARVVDVAEERLDNLKGGAVLSDAKMDKVVGQMAALFNADPAQVLGMIQQAGKDASSAVAHMEAGYLVTARMFQDTYALASRIRLGDFAEFGSREAALAELKKRASIATSIYGAARSITAAGGRSVRRMLGQFRIDPAAVDAMNTMDAEKLVTLLESSDGDPRNIARALNPSLWSKTVDFGQFLLINNLVSGPKTQLINLLTNSYMVLARPAERILGAAVHGRIEREALRQYTYLGTSFVEGFRFARQAFTMNDSVLAPHRTEAYRGNQMADAMARPANFKPWDSPGNILGNALKVSVLGIGLPTRTLGFVDEAVKQTVYRSKLMTQAHTDAVEQGIEAGLKGKELKDFVSTFMRDKVDAGFDANGVGTDVAALREAQIATFQQELLPGTLGKLAQSGVQTLPALRLVLPFVKTPTNVIRYGWKMTPGLNLLQREYRDMLTGRMGMEAKMQATGQMMMGGLWMGAAAFLSSRGTLTGSGPSNRQHASELMATGWQPYSVVVQNEDGTKTYIPYGRLDPVAIPFGMMVDLMDAYHALNGEETPELEAAIGAVLTAMARQFTSKTYLTGVSSALEAMMEPERSAMRTVGQTAANFIPFSAALRQLNPDPYLRDARDMVDRLQATLPGSSEGLPPRRDAWGDPMRRVGLWSSEEDQFVDREVQRLILESGSSVLPPNPVNSGVDLRDLTMSDGRNAYAVYQELAGHPKGAPALKQQVARMMRTRAYQLAPDGEVGTKGTKLWLLHKPIAKYRERAMKMLKRDPLVRDAFRADDLKARAKFLENRKAAQQPSPMQKLGDGFGQDLRGL